jgi:glyoxylase-like metal-dependent hydrolase (beta-lactamase superfamily II)
MRLELQGHDLVGIRASNPGPFTLSGTNSWIVGSDPCWLIDPGPALDEHLDAVGREIDARGGLAGVALTHDHADHSAALPAVRRRYPHASVAAARGQVDTLLTDGSSFGPLLALATPGHSPDHLAYLAGEVAFTGDAVLGQGSVFISPYPGALSSYLAGLRRLSQHRLVLLCPGHGPPVNDPAGKLNEYISHRLDRERRLLSALDRGQRTVQELLDEVWDDVPPALRPAAGWTLAAHLDKLEEEGRLPAGVERPESRLPSSV